MTLNPLQQKAYDRIIEKGSNIITGSAGTGKTFVLSKSVNSLVELGHKVLICSPTHQSLKVIRKALDISHPNVVFKTLASTLARFPMLNKDSGDTFFVKGKLTKVIRESDYIFIDEISSVSDKDLRIILALSKIKKINLFGDMSQLLPVRQKSICLSNIKGFSHINLIQQMRNKSDIEELAEKNREKIYLPNPNHKSKNIISCGNEEKLLSNFLERLNKSNNPLDICYLAFTNNTVDYVSSKICINKYPYLRINTNYNSFTKNGDILKIVSKESINNVDSKFNFSYDVLVVEHLENNHLFHINYVDRENYLIISKAIKNIKESIKHTSDIEYKQFLFSELEYLQSFPTFSSPFVLTVHKSQGSTFNEVFINTKDILRSTNKKRLMYVAISRAKNKLFLV